MTNITFIILAHINNYTAFSKQRITVQPYPVALISNYSKTYTFNPAQGFNFYPILTYPQCPLSQQRTAIGLLNCTVLDENMTVLEPPSPNNCKITPNYYFNHSTVYLNFKYTGSPFQKNLSDTIALETGVGGAANFKNKKVSMLQEQGEVP